MNRISRQVLLGAASAIALVGLPLMTRFVEAAQGADPADLDALNAAITLERAAIKAYNDGSATGLLTKPTLSVAAGFVMDHTAHREALIAAVKAGGGVPTNDVAKIVYPALKSEQDVLRFALLLEQKTANTYVSMVPDFKDRELAKLTAAILGIETTHVALLCQALNQPTPYSTGLLPIT